MYTRLFGTLEYCLFKANLWTRWKSADKPHSLFRFFLKLSWHDFSIKHVMLKARAISFHEKFSCTFCQMLRLNRSNDELNEFRRNPALIKSSNFYLGSKSTIWACQENKEQIHLRLECAPWMCLIKEFSNGHIFSFL